MGALNINLTLTLDKRDSILNGMACYEPVDLEVLDKLRNSTLLVSSFTNPLSRDMVGSETKQLDRYKSLCDKSTKLARIVYKRNMKYGRCLVQHSIGLFGMRKKIRHTLANRVGLCDWDIVNAHPDILLQICKANGLACDKLQDYVLNRDIILDRIMTEIPCLSQKRDEDRDRAKNLFIRILYFGEWRNWLDEKKNRDGVIEECCIPYEHISSWLEETVVLLSSQLKKIGDNIMKANPQLIKEVKKNKEDKNQKEYNEMGAVVSFFLQEHENRILEAVYSYCISKGYIRDNICVLCADGIMLEKSLLPEDAVFSNELTTIVKEKCGFIMSFKPKSLNEDMIDILDSSLFGIASLDQTKLAKWDGMYFNSLGSYAEKKIYFENFVCKIIKPDPAYVFMETENADVGKTNVFYSQSKITEAFNHLKSGEVYDNGEEVKFITKWLGDEDIKVYTRMDFKPRADNEPEDKSTFNLFAGFNPHINTPYDRSNKERYLKHFIGIGKALCGGDDAYWKYFLNYLAHIVQFPHEKIPIAFIIKGKQGTGKNVFLGVIGTIIGLSHYITSSNPKDFFGDYAEGFYNKLLVNMNECEGRDTFDFEGRIKSFITEDTITLNRKFVQAIVILNLARLIITTNKPTPIPIDVRSKDRRYVVYETTDEYLDAQYGTQFWTQLIGFFKRPEVIACIYDYLMEQDIKNYDWRANRPITKAYIQMCKSFIPAEVLFLENKILLIKEMDLSIKDGADMMETYVDKFGLLGSVLYKEFDDYSKEFGLFRGKDTSAKPKITTFYSRLRELNLENLINKKVDGQEKFYFNATNLLIELKHKGLVSRNEDDILEDVMREVNAGKDFTDDFL